VDVSAPGVIIISEFYQLRRTAIKDITSYLGFLAGFIGSAPFAWGLLAAQLDAGRFARGLWYFFGIVFAAGIFSGIAGLGLGMAAGALWELIHRHRRSMHQKESAANISESLDRSPRRAELTADQDVPPRLQLVSSGTSRAAAGRNPAADDVPPKPGGRDGHG
jgi:hypothetical protein